MKKINLYHGTRQYRKQHEHGVRNRRYAPVVVGQKGDWWIAADRNGTFVRLRVDESFPTQKAALNGIASRFGISDAKVVSLAASRNKKKLAA